MLRAALVAVLVIGTPIWSTCASAQSYAPAATTGTPELALPNAADLNRATAVLEQYLKENGVIVPASKTPGATPQPQPQPAPAPPPGTPIAGPMPLPPPGPGTFTVLPPTLEAYRIQLEKKRTLLEMSRDERRVSKSEYLAELSEYRRDILIYKKASNLSAGEQVGGPKE